MSEQERVRRLLGGLRATDDATPPAMPADLAAHLDARLAEAAREERDTPRERALAPVVPLRRRLAPVLVAAAVVLVAGGVVVGLQQGGGDQASSSADAGGSGAASSESGEDPAGGGAEPEVADEGGRNRLDEAPDDTTSRMTAAPYLTAAGFPADVRALVRGGEVATGDAPRQDAAARERVEGSGCAVPDDDLGAATLVSLDGEPAVLVVGPVSDGRQAVAVRDCLGRTVDRTTVPAR